MTARHTHPIRARQKRRDRKWHRTRGYADSRRREFARRQQQAENS